MQKWILLLAFAGLLFSCKDAGQKDGDAPAQDSTDLTMVTPVVPLSDFHASAAAYVDKEIITQGVVDHVCKHGGKRLFLVNDDADLHIDGEERFDEELGGSQIEVTGIVREFRVDEAYCLKMEEDNIKAHNNGELDKEQYQHKIEQLTFYRDSMKVAGVDHLSFYSLDYLSHKEIK